MPEQTSTAQMATLAADVRNAVESIARVETKVNELLALDRTMAQMQQAASHQQGEIAEIWKRIDGQTKSIDSLAIETRAFINRASGAWVAVAVMLSIVQVAIVAWVGWVFTSVQSTRELAAVHEHRLKVIETRETQRTFNER